MSSYALGFGLDFATSTTTSRGSTASVSMPSVRAGLCDGADYNVEAFAVSGSGAALIRRPFRRRHNTATPTNTTAADET